MCSYIEKNSYSKTNSNDKCNKKFLVQLKEAASSIHTEKEKNTKISEGFD